MKVFLTPQEEEKVEEAVTKEVEEEVIEEDELPEAAELEEEMVEDEESDFDDEIDDEEQTEVEDEQEQPTYKVRIDGEEVERSRLRNSKADIHVSKITRAKLKSCRNNGKPLSNSNKS